MDRAGASATGGRCLRYVDVRPYAVPTALDELTGPVRGDVTLPKALAWGPRRTFDVGNADDRRLTYEVVLQRRTPPQNSAYM